MNKKQRVEQHTDDFYKVWYNDELIVHYQFVNHFHNGRQFAKLYSNSIIFSADYYEINDLKEGEDLRINNE